MEELLTCSINCQNKPIYVCDCSDEKVFFCLNHAAQHGETDGNHHFTRIMKIPDPETKIIISKFLKNLKKQTAQDRLKIIQESSLLIKQIKEETNKSLEKLFLIEKKLDEYLYLCETLNEINTLNNHSFIESLLKLSAEESSKIKYRDDLMSINSADFKEKIENLFSIQDPKILFDIDNYEIFNLSKEAPIIKYFANQSLYAINLVSLDSIPQNIDKNWSFLDSNCLLNDGSIFCCSESETFIINPDNSLVTLNSSNYSSFSGLISIDDFVYIFGGTSDASLKLSLKSKNWSGISQYPISNNRFISCAFINSVILIAGHGSPLVYGYSISNDSYEKIAIELNKNTGKSCLSTKSKAYIIEYNKNYYESGLNDINTWTLIGNANILVEGNPRHSYSLQHGNNFYFITCDYRLIRFNLKNKQLKLLKTL